MSYRFPTLWCRIEQVVFRIGTILGESVDNQIAALFDRRKMLEVTASDSLIFERGRVCRVSRVTLTPSTDGRGRIGIVRRRFEKGLTVSRNDGSEHDGSVHQVVEAASALDDKDFLAVVRAVVERRPSLSVLLSVVDTAAASLEPNRVEDENENTITDAEEVELPDTVVEVDEIIDVPVVLATDPRIPEPDYTEGGVPTFDRVREKIEGRFGTSVGSAELAHESPAGKSVDEQWDERQKAAKAKLEEIRRSMGK